jgi:hypothetical protein
MNREHSVSQQGSFGSWLLELCVHSMSRQTTSGPSAINSNNHAMSNYASCTPNATYDGKPIACWLLARRIKADNLKSNL